MEHYEAKYRETKLQYLRSQAAKLGMRLVANDPALTAAC
jgi:hypothetical protein